MEASAHLFVLEEPRPVTRLVRLDGEGVALGQHVPRVREDSGLREPEARPRRAAGGEHSNPHQGYAHAASNVLEQWGGKRKWDADGTVWVGMAQRGATGVDERSGHVDYDDPLSNT